VCGGAKLPPMARPCHSAARSARLVRLGQTHKGGQRASGPGPLARQGARKIDFAGFQRAVDLLADARGCAPEAVRRAVVLSGGPQTNTHVTPDYVRLHDDKSTYSGARPAPRHCGLHGLAPDSARPRACRPQPAAAGLRRVNVRCVCHSRAAAPAHLCCSPDPPGCGTRLPQPGRQAHNGWPTPGGCAAGVYAKGGPSTVDKRITLASITARSDRPNSS